MASIAQGDNNVVRDALLGFAPYAARFVLTVIVGLLAIFAYIVVAGWLLEYYIYGSFARGESKLTIFAAGAPISDVYGLVAIHNGDAASSITLEDREWAGTLAIWQRARSFPQPAWWRAGDITDEDAYNSRLSIYGGPGIRFVLRQDRSCVVYDIAPKDEDAVQRALVRVQDHLAGNVTTQGVPQHTLSEAFDVAVSVVRSYPTPPTPTSPQSAAQPC